jgi:hypothetical protein
MPVCPVGHLVLAERPEAMTFLRWIIFEKYETFCHHCQRRYVVYRWRITLRPRSGQGGQWHIWRYKVWPGDASFTVDSPPAEVLTELNGMTV